MKKLFALAGLVVLTACSTSQLVDSLDIVQVAADVAAADSNIPTAAAPYLTAVSTGAICASTELQSGDSAAVQATRLTACFAGAIKPALPAGTPAIIVGEIDAIGTAIGNFLSKVPSAQVVAAAPAGAFGFAPDAKTKPVKLSKKDKAKLADIHKRATTNLGRIKK
jgi:hypothetical protein